MAITLSVTGNGSFKGASTNLSGYSSTEDSTPIDPSDSSGGTGQASYTVVEDANYDGSILLHGDSVELEDGSNGRTAGRVTAVSSNNGEVTITASSRLNLLVVEQIIGAYSGTLDGAFRYYLSSVGITTGIVVDSSIAGRIVALPAISGSLWDNLKRLCSAQQIEVSLVSSNIVLRPLRGRTAEVLANSDESWTVEDGDLAQTVEVYYYNNVYKSSGLAYPPSFDDLGTTMQIDTSEVITYSVSTDASLTGIQQPTPVSYVPHDYVGLSSVYSIIDSQGEYVNPGEWSRAGGNIVVAIGEDYKTIIVTIYGPSLTVNAPYRIEGIAGPGYSYSSLRLVGSGVFSDPRVLTLPTAVPASIATQVVGITVQNPYISTLAQAYTAGLIVAGKYGTAAQSITTTATRVNRKNDVGSVNYPTFDDFDAEWAGNTFTQFGTAQGTRTFADFDKYMLSTVADTFANQAFGNVAGARVKYRAAWYRIRSATVTHDTISYSGERDTLFGDFTSLWAGKTFADFSASMANKTFADFGVIPLWQ